MGNIYNDDLLNISEGSGWKKTDSARKDASTVIKVVIWFIVAGICMGVIIYNLTMRGMNDSSDGKYSIEDLAMSDSISGTYTGYFNGMDSTIIIRKDGTCKFPVFGDGTWDRVDDNHIKMIHPEHGTVNVEIVDGGLIYSVAGGDVYFTKVN